MRLLLVYLFRPPLRQHFYHLGILVCILGSSVCKYTKCGRIIWAICKMCMRRFIVKLWFLYWKATVDKLVIKIIFTVQFGGKEVQMSFNLAS